jgi:hypothetical protein
MKALIFLFAATFLFCSSSYGQQISTKLIINGDPNRNYFSRSEQNVIVVEGTGCARFELSGVGVTLVERSGDYYVQVNTLGLEALITVYGIIDGKKVMLATYKFRVVN